MMSTSYRRPGDRGSNVILIVVGVVAAAVVLLMVGGAVGFWLLEKAPAKPEPTQAEKPVRESLKVKPEVKQPKTVTPPTAKVDEKAASLRKADDEVMSLFRMGKPDDAFKRLMKAIEPYAKLTPKDCTVEESLAIAVIYARVATFIGKSDPKLTSTYTLGAIEHAKRSGMAESEIEVWFNERMNQTQDVIGKR